MHAKLLQKEKEIMSINYTATISMNYTTAVCLSDSHFMHLTWPLPNTFLHFLSKTHFQVTIENVDIKQNLTDKINASFVDL